MTTSKPYWSTCSPFSWISPQNPWLFYSFPQVEHLTNCSQRDKTPTVLIPEELYLLELDLILLFLISLTISHTRLSFLHTCIKLYTPPLVQSEYITIYLNFFVVHVCFLQLEDDFVFFKHLFLQSFDFSSAEIKFLVHIFGIKGSASFFDSIVESLN